MNRKQKKQYARNIAGRMLKLISVNVNRDIIEINFVIDHLVSNLEKMRCHEDILSVVDKLEEGNIHE